ncbi:helix-turn-helix domain-containing protein [Nonomuraea rubra]|uniref:helix-turn-helix domain-containing protein n=1 Tax=Nonomuraea rubra TaxID=46180 RepID=UPI00360F1E85
MSQLALAHHAQVSPRHLSFVESGRSTPSREWIMTLAGALQVPLRERNDLLLAAGYAPSTGSRPSPSPPWPRSGRPWTACWPTTSPTRPWSWTATGTSPRPIAPPR